MTYSILINALPDITAIKDSNLTKIKTIAKSKAIYKLFEQIQNEVNIFAAEERKHIDKHGKFDSKGGVVFKTLEDGEKYFLWRGDALNEAVTDFKTDGLPIELSVAELGDLPIVPRWFGTLEGLIEFTGE
jgi:hypothetical protein